MLQNECCCRHRLRYSRERTVQSLTAACATGGYHRPPTPPFPSLYPRTPAVPMAASRTARRHCLANDRRTDRPAAGCQQKSPTISRHFSYILRLKRCKSSVRKTYRYRKNAAHENLRTSVQRSASIQPRTSLQKLFGNRPGAGCPCVSA